MSQYHRSGPYIGTIEGRVQWVYLEFNENGLLNILVKNSVFKEESIPFWFACSSVSRPKSAKFQLFSLEENIEYIAIIDETQFCMINRSTHYLNLYKNTLVPMVKYLDENHKLRVSYTRDLSKCLH